MWTELEQGGSWAWFREARRKATVLGFSRALCLIQTQPNLVPLGMSGASGPRFFSLQLLCHLLELSEAKTGHKRTSLGA